MYLQESSKWSASLGFEQLSELSGLSPGGAEGSSPRRSPGTRPYYDLYRLSYEHFRALFLQLAPYPFLPAAPAEPTSPSDTQSAEKTRLPEWLEKLAQKIFALLDSNRDTSVNLLELAWLLGVLFHGDLRQKLLLFYYAHLFQFVEYAPASPLAKPKLTQAGSGSRTPIAKQASDTEFELIGGAESAAPAAELESAVDATLFCDGSARPSPAHQPNRADPWRRPFSWQNFVAYESTPHPVASLSKAEFSWCPHNLLFDTQTLHPAFSQPQFLELWGTLYNLIELFESDISRIQASATLPDVAATAPKPKSGYGFGLLERITGYRAGRNKRLTDPIPTPTTTTSVPTQYASDTPPVTGDNSEPDSTGPTAQASGEQVATSKSLEASSSTENSSTSNINSSRLTSLSGRAPFSIGELTHSLAVAGTLLVKLGESRREGPHPHQPPPTTESLHPNAAEQAPAAREERSSSPVVVLAEAEETRTGAGAAELDWSITFEQILATVLTEQQLADLFERPPSLYVLASTDSPQHFDSGTASPLIARIAALRSKPFSATGFQF